MAALHLTDSFLWICTYISVNDGKGKQWLRHNAMARLADNIKGHSNSNLVVSDDFNCRAAEVIWGRKNSYYK